MSNLLFGYGCMNGNNQSLNSAVDSVSEESYNSSDESCSESLDTDTYNGVIQPLILPDIVEEVEDMYAFSKQADDKFNPQKNGIVKSPYYSVKVRDIYVPTYTVPANYGKFQNVAFVDVSEDAFPLKFRVSPSYAVDKADVIPTYYGAQITKQANDIVFDVNSYGYYTVRFNGGYENVLTVCVRKYEDVAIPNGYNVIEYKKGIHFVDYISIPSNTVLYLHRGAYLIAKVPSEDEEPEMAENYHGETTWRPFIDSKRSSNVKILGRGVIDMSALYWCARNPIDFNWCDGVEIDGVTVINTANWNITVANCKNVTVKNVVLLSYRRNSDGIAIVDCDGAVVSDCFARSGDDLFEVKSMYANSDVECKNIKFERCIAWADSCRGMGVIHETAKDISNVTFSNSAVLYAMATWSKDMGSLVVINGIRGNVSNITFKNIEVYYDAQYALNIALGPNEWSESDEVGEIHDVLYENINLINGGRVRIKYPHGKESLISDITFKNILICGKKAESVDDLGIEYEGGKIEVKYER